MSEYTGLHYRQTRLNKLIKTVTLLDRWMLQEDCMKAVHKELLGAVDCKNVRDRA